jgi:hypothetical protein
MHSRSRVFATPWHVFVACLLTVRVEGGDEIDDVRSGTSSPPPPGSPPGSPRPSRSQSSSPFPKLRSAVALQAAMQVLQQPAMEHSNANVAASAAAVLPHSATVPSSPTRASSSGGFRRQDRRVHMQEFEHLNVVPPEQAPAVMAWDGITSPLPLSPTTCDPSCDVISQRPTGTLSVMDSLLNISALSSVDDCPVAVVPRTMAAMAATSAANKADLIVFVVSADATRIRVVHVVSCAHLRTAELASLDLVSGTLAVASATSPWVELFCLSAPSAASLTLTAVTAVSLPSQGMPVRPRGLAFATAMSPPALPLPQALHKVRARCGPLS